MARGGEGASLEYTPTWVVAVVCTIIVGISFAGERGIHYSGKLLMKKNQKPLYQALQKVKEELMLLGFISLVLMAFQNTLSKFCVSKKVMNHGLPCQKEYYAKSTAHMMLDMESVFGRRHLLAGGASDSEGYCGAKGKVPLLSLDALHDLHIFIFVLAVSHIIFSGITIAIGVWKMREWKHWEQCIQNSEYDPEEAMKSKITCVKDNAFIRGRISGLARVAVISWIKSFRKQFYGITRSEYTTLRHGFIMAHLRSNPKFNFYKYMVRAFERDFKKVVGISWYLWVFVVIFLLVNVNGWHAYFWISFVPLILLLAVGTKLEHIITELAIEVAHKHVAVEGDLAVKPSDDYFWFHRPRLVLFLIHLLMFQNAFEIAVFFWMFITFGFDSCIMGEVGFIVPRLVIGVFVQFICSYSTLPLYAIVAQMGSSFSPAIFDESLQAGLVDWAQKAKLKKKVQKSVGGGNSNTNPHQVSNHESPLVEPQNARGKSPEIELQG